MPYILLDDLKPLIPSAWLTEALDDDANGSPEMFTGVRDAAELAVNGVLSLQYTVPIATPASFPFLKHVTSLEAARLCYARRGYEDKGFPHSASYEAAWKQLSQIGRGELQLGPAAQSNAVLAKPRGSVITGKSRTFSTTGALSA